MRDFVGGFAPVPFFWAECDVAITCHVCEWHTSQWEMVGNDHKAISFVAVPPLSMSVSLPNLFCSPSLSICLHLAPTGEGQSIDLLSPLPESGVKSAQGPPVFRPCSHIVSPGCWLLLQRRAGERPSQSITRTSQGREKSLSPTRPERQHRSTMCFRVNSRRCGTFASHRVFFFFYFPPKLFRFRWYIHLIIIL